MSEASAARRARGGAAGPGLRRGAFAAALVLLVLAVHGGLVAFAIAAERREVANRLDLQTREATRLAVARLDAVLMPLVVAESARPSEHFDMFLRTDPEDSPPTAVPAPSPLLLTDLPFRLLHFTWSDAEELRSPQVLRPTLRPLVAQYGPSVGARLDAAADRLAELEALVPRATWGQLLTRSQGAPSPLLAGQPSDTDLIAADLPPGLPALPPSLARRLAGAVDQKSPGMRGHFLRPAPSDADVLLLARRAEVDEHARLEGVWIDWPKLRGQLLEEVNQPLAGRAVQLVPLTRSQEARADQRLAALPAALLVGELEWPPPLGWSATRQAVAVASGVMLVALALGAWALFAAWELGERRARFASGVTHELRTPLTTFQLYSELLAEDRIADPARRREALETLRSESARLARVVENVLAQARLERRSTQLAREPFDLGALLLRLAPHLARRTGEAGLELDLALPEEGEATCRGDPGAVEQILVNLVDNAAKYAAGSEPPRVELDVVQDARHVVVRVRDHGPGIPMTRRRELFLPFFRAGADPHIQGLGLGLSLSRDLARGMGAELEHQAPEDGGARFALRLVAEPRSAPRNA